MKILVVGHNGMLGKAIVKECESYYDIKGVDLPKIDIGDIDSLYDNEDLFKWADVLINCAAITDVEACESNLITEAFRVNTTGVYNLALICCEYKVKFCHVSTDFVFDGQRKAPYSDDDKRMNPLSVYGVSKMTGERLLTQFPNSYLIIRTAWLFGHGKKNFVEKVIERAKTGKLEVVSDLYGSPTYATDLALWIRLLIKKEVSGTFNCVNSGKASWFDFAQEIVSQMDLDVEVIPITNKEAMSRFNMKATRPSYSVLANKKARAACGCKFRNWEKALSEYLLERKA